MWRRFSRLLAAGPGTLKAAIVAAGALLLAAPMAPTDASGAWQLVWADEFDSDGELSSADWSYEHGFVRNRELQWYQCENAFVENGMLVIEGRHETIRNSNHDPSSNDWRESRKFARYTSASVNTKGRHDWRYGRFEVRARIRAEDGLWPAIWFLGVDGGWPSNGEIDLMEYYAGDILANAAWGRPARSGGKPVWNATRTPVGSFGPDWANEFHTWRMDWDESSIELYVDDRLLNTIDVGATVNPPGVLPQYPFRQPHYLLLNLAIGGQGGNPEGTAFPTRYEIDYVRVYQRSWTGLR
jgi:beta-glucanase (GH16 family)